MERNREGLLARCEQLRAVSARGYGPGIFVYQLVDQRLATESIDGAIAAFDQSILRHHRTPLTFRLDSKKNDSLPPGWTSFLSSLGKHIKVSHFALL